MISTDIALLNALAAISAYITHQDNCDSNGSCTHSLSLMTFCHQGLTTWMTESGLDLERIATDVDGKAELKAACKDFIFDATEAHLRIASLESLLSAVRFCAAKALDRMRAVERRMDPTRN
jgi:hypothetical protein